MLLDIGAFRGKPVEAEGEPGIPGGENELQSVSRQARLLLLGMVAALVVLALFPVKGAVIGTGEVNVDSRVKIITHPSGGVLSEIRVREGQHVERGQVLALLDQSVLGPSARNAALSRDQLLALRARLEAERDNRPVIVFPPGLISRRDTSAAVAMDSERRQFQLGRTERESTLALLQQRVRQLNEQINSYRAQIDATRQQLALIQPELEGLRELRGRGLVTVNRLNEMERTAVQLTATEASLQADIAQTEARISETREQILNVSQSRRVEAGAELARVVAQLTEQDSRTISMQDTLQRATVVAPQAGTVDQIFYTTPGSAVPPSEPFIRLVPEEDRLVITARIAPGDVDALRLGQETRVRFSTLDRNLSPEIPGKLIFVAAERTDDPQTGLSYYRVEIEVAESEMDALGTGQLRAGQPVEVFFTTSSRSILSYALKPFMDQIRKAIRE
jgi:HlyD family type I secretion membrane fusion protein